jgi:hypothetical protein
MPGRIGTFVCVLVALATTGLAAGTGDAQFDEALALYRQARWAGAFGRFCALADRGNADAADLALLMVRLGPQMHGSAWTASQPQIDRWLALTAKARPISVSAGPDD